MASRHPLNEERYVTDEQPIIEDVLQLSRLGLSGRAQDVQLYIRRMLKRHRESLPSLCERLDSLLRESPVRSSPLRRESGSSAIPVDLDSRLHLIRVDTGESLRVEPVLAPSVAGKLHQLVEERKSRSRLAAARLQPTRTALFVGEPGVGKTLAAKWAARELNLPLLTLDLAAVMSSFLGRTGNNVRYVLDYAKSIDCVLLLDELDAVAKRRDDTAEVGELKRLVTVLLQEIDEWPSEGLLLAATNHPSLLDPAVWRRFELVVEFPKPEGTELTLAVQRFLGEDLDADLAWSRVLPVVFRGLSFSDIEREITAARRSATISGTPLSQALITVVRGRVESLSKRERATVAAEMVRSGTLSQREANDMFGTSRDTIRKVLRETSSPRK